MRFYKQRFLIFGFLSVLVFLQSHEASGVDIGIINGDFELDGADDVGPPTGWTDNSASPSFWTGVADEGGNPTSAQTDLAPGFGVGTYFLTSARTSAGFDSQPNDGQLVQTVDLSSFASAIDTGNEFLFVDFIWSSNDGRDTGVFSLEFFDSADGTGNVLGTPYSVALDADNGFAFTGWFEESVGGAVPANTRSVTLQLDTTRTGGSETNLWLDNFVGDITNTPVIVNRWNVDGGGSFNSAGNWLTLEVPTQEAIFGNVLTEANAPAEITIDTEVSLERVSFQNTNAYVLAGPEALVLTGDREIAVAGNHQITADIAGTSGLVVTNGGTLFLRGAKSYTGATDVQSGTLQIDSLDAIDNRATGVLNVDATGTVLLTTGASGSLETEITGSGLLNLTDDLDAADSVTLARANSAFSGLIRVDAGTLVVADNNALGQGGGTADRTALDDDSTSRVHLPGGVTIASEVLDMDGRSTDAVGLSSEGNNAWNGVIDGQGNSGQTSRFNIESTAGTLTLGDLHAGDFDGPQVFTFSGAGDTTVTGRISEDAFDDVSGGVVPSAFDNVGVVKRGTGTLTIAIGANGGGGRIDYWFGPTDIEAGTVVVTAAPGNVGELMSSDINIRSGAVLDTSSFATYAQQTANLGTPGAGQTIRGSGEIIANTLALFDDGSIAPGDAEGVSGTLNVMGNVTLNSGDSGGAWHFDLGNDAQPTADLLEVSGSFSTNGTPSLTIQVSPAHGHLDAGNRTIVAHQGGTNAGINNATAQITTPSGIALDPRQTVSVNGNVPGQIDIVVSGEEASRTWNGNVDGNWDVGSTVNWQEGDRQFRDLDRVTFDDTATGTTQVTVDGVRYSGEVTFNNSAKTYTFTGAGGIVGSGDVDVNSGAVQLRNTGNNFSGTTTVASGATLELVSATTGSMIVDGTLVVGDGLVRAKSYTYVDADRSTNTAPGSAILDGVNNQADDDLWSERTGFASGGTVFQSGDGDGENAPELTTTLTGLEPNTAYEVNVHFWDADPDGPWQIRAGLTSGATTLYSDPDETAGDGASPAVLASDLAYDVAPTVLTESNRTMFAARLGEGTTDESGNLQLFIDDLPSDSGVNRRTWYDGVSFVSGETGGFIGGETLTVDGDLIMGLGSLLELDLAADGFDSVEVSGIATLGGVIDVSFLGSIQPESGATYTILSADGGITTPIESLDFGSGLPASFSASYDEDMTSLILSYAAGLAGDFNNDGLVNLADYTFWRDNLGELESVLPGGSGDNSGIVDGGDFAVWKSNFGNLNAGATTATAAIPEPASSWLIASLIAAGLLGWGRSYRSANCIGRTG